MEENNGSKEGKFFVTKEEFMSPYKRSRDNNNMICENLKSKGMKEEEINDYLQMIDND